MGKGTVDVLVTGLPGTGKTLVAEVLRSFRYELPSVAQNQATTKMCKDFLMRHYPGQSPYYCPARYIPPWNVSLHYEGCLPQVMVVAFVGTALPVIGTFRPCSVILCDRSLEAWLAAQPEPEKNQGIDFGGVWTSVTTLSAGLVSSRVPALRFNVDHKRFSYETAHEIQGGPTYEALNQRLAELLECNPDLGR